MKRGQIVTVALAGDYGKPRPAVVVQGDELADIGSVLVCPMTSHEAMAAPFRPQVEPMPQNGLTRTSFAMTDKITTVPRGKCGRVVGQLDAADMSAIDESVLFTLGLGD